MPGASVGTGTTSSGDHIDLVVDTRVTLLTVLVNTPGAGERNGVANLWREWEVSRRHGLPHPSGNNAATAQVPVDYGKR